MNRWLAVSCLALALLAAGCGSDDEDDGGGTPTAERPAETGGVASPGVTVSMKDIKFVPMEVTVKSGATIKWTNDDSVTHTVTKMSGAGGSFDSGNLAGGKTFERKFDEVGKIDYFCSIHPQQIGTITVE